ncbi:GMP synthase [Purpureocillium lavendulum]|uniref:GMP synthase n=1 Tax=Purpureocillium lavendulum TaxID=1247861 RepID=A0AB34G272_9HYPO|nr:GMP synthase [Purpureocillium lavendulum]
MDDTDADSGVSRRTLTIILATAIPSVVLIVAIVTVLCCRRRARKARLFDRGITPIGDEEIESWKRSRMARGHHGQEEKVQAPTTPPQRHDSKYRSQAGNQGHRATTSASSVQKPAAVIVYQTARVSEDVPISSPPNAKRSFDVGPTPVLARAPNSRPGLTDETVQGEDAFVVTQIKRNPSRLAKAPPPSAGSSPPRHHGRSKSTRATMTGTTGGQDLWYGQPPECPLPPRRSADMPFPPSPSYRGGGQAGTYSSRSTPQRTSFDDDDGEQHYLGGLSPRPLIHQSEIGRAIG